MDPLQYVSLQLGKGVESHGLIGVFLALQDIVLPEWLLPSMRLIQEIIPSKNSRRVKQHSRYSMATIYLIIPIGSRHEQMGLMYRPRLHPRSLQHLLHLLPRRLPMAQRAFDSRPMAIPPSPFLAYLHSPSLH